MKKFFSILAGVLLFTIGMMPIMEAQAKGGSFGGGGRSFSSFSSSRSSSFSSRPSAPSSGGWSFFRSSPAPVAAPKPTIVQNVYKPVTPAPVQKPVITQVPAAKQVVAKKPELPKTTTTVASTAPARTTPVVASSSTSDEEKKKREAARAKARDEARKRRQQEEQDRLYAQRREDTHVTYAPSYTNHESSSMMPMLMGGMVGYLIGSSGNAHAAPQQLTAEQAAQYPTCPNPIPEGYNIPCVMRPVQQTAVQPVQPVAEQTQPTPGSAATAVANTSSSTAAFAH